MKIEYYEDHLTLLSERLHIIFQTFGWTWSDGVPTASEIRKTIEFLIAQVEKEGIEFSSTGRITVTRTKVDDISIIHIYLDMMEGEIVNEK